MEVNFFLLLFFLFFCQAAISTGMPIQIYVCVFFSCLALSCVCISSVCLSRGNGQAHLLGISPPALLLLPKPRCLRRRERMRSDNTLTHTHAHSLKYVRQCEVTIKMTTGSDDLLWLRTHYAMTNDIIQKSMQSLSISVNRWLTAQ